MSYTDEFDGPGSTAAINWADQKGNLLLVEALSLETGIKTEFGEADAIRANVVILDAPGGAQELTDILVFPKVLQGQIRKNVGTGRRNLGRLGQGEKKPGKSAPWLLQDPTEADKTAARAWLSATAVAPF